MKDQTMKTSTYAVLITAIAITSIGANAYTIQNIRNISATREACSEQNNVNIKNCQLRVVNLTPKMTQAQQLTLLMPPELNN